MSKLDCGHIPTKTSGPGTGYGRNSNGKTFCYDCAAELDRQHMREHGRTCLYLYRAKRPHTVCGSMYGEFKVTNWPGTLSFPVRRVKRGRHNIARVRYDFWFTFEGDTWHGVQYGDNTQIAHCKRLKH